MSYVSIEVCCWVKKCLQMIEINMQDIIMHELTALIDNIDEGEQDKSIKMSK